jgi:hypothetical protein
LRMADHHAAEPHWRAQVDGGLDGVFRIRIVDLSEESAEVVSDSAVRGIGAGGPAKRRR